VKSGRDRGTLQVQLEIETEWTQWPTGKPWSSEFGYALGGQGWVISEMHFEAVSEWIWRCNWRQWSSKFGDAQGSHDRVNSEMHSEAVIERVWRCTRRLWLSEIGGELGAGRSGGGWWEARLLLSLYSSVSLLETVAMWWGDFTVEAPMENWLVEVDR